MAGRRKIKRRFEKQKLLNELERAEREHGWIAFDVLMARLPKVFLWICSPVAGASLKAFWDWIRQAKGW